MKIFWNTETRKLQRGFDDKSPVSLNELMRAERESTIPITLYLVPMATPGTTDYTFSLRRDGANIDTGTAKISWSTGETAAIDLTAPKLAQRIEAALNSVSEIDAAGGVDCTQMIAGRAYQIGFRSNGVRTLSTVALDTAQPDGSKIVEIDPGTATTKARHLLLLDEGELATVVAATDWSATSAPAVTLTVVNAGSGTVRTVTKVKITGDPAPGSYLILNGSDPIPVDATGAEFAAKLSISTEVEKIGEYEWQITNTAADNTVVVEGTHSLDRWPGLTATIDLDTAEMAAYQPAQLIARLIQGTDTLVSETVRLSTGTIANISGTSLAVYPRATITTTAPTVTDDADNGHGLLSKWLDTTSGLVYTLTDNTAGAAVWVEGAAGTVGTAELADPPGSPTQTLLHRTIPTLAGVVTDESGNGNHGQLKGAGACFVDGDLFELAFSPTPLQSLSAFTICINWTFQGTLNTNSAFIGGDLAANTLPMIRLTETDGTNGTITAWADIGGTTDSAASASGVVVAGGSYHIAATYDGTDLKAYVDGVEVATTAVTVPAGSTHASATGTMIGGGQNASSNENDGTFWDARIYDTALTAAELVSIAAAAPIDNEPVAWWPCCEQGGVTLHDVSGNGYHITGTVGTAFWDNTQDVFHYLAHYGGTSEIYSGSNGGNADNIAWTPALMDGSADADSVAIGTPAGPYLYAGRGTLDTVISETAYAAPAQRTNPDFARIEGDGKASRFVSYASALSGDALTQAQRFAASVHTITTDGAWSWFSSPRALVQSDGTLLVGSVDNAAGDFNLTHYTPSTKTASTFAIGSVTEIDDHNNPALAITDAGKVLVAYQRHNADNLTRYRLSTTALVDAVGDLAAETTEDNGSTTSYANLLVLDNGEIWNFTRVNQQWGYSKSTDDAATWSAWQQFHSSTNDVNCYSRFTSTGNRIWVTANDGYPNGYNTSVFAFYIEGGSVYEPDGTLISTVAAIDAGAAISLTALAGTSAEVYAYTAGTIDIADGVSSGRAWVWDLAIDSSGAPVIAYHLEVLATPTYAGDGSTVYRASTDRIYYYGARYGGGVEWDVDFIGHGGYGVSPYSPSYSGGIAIGEADDTWYFSTSADSPTSRIGTVGIVGGSAIWKARKDSDGIWHYSEIVPLAWEGHSAMRPEMVTDGTNSYLLFLSGYYSWFDAGDYTTTIKAIELPTTKTERLPGSTRRLMSNLIDDTTPQLGGALDLNSQEIQSTGGTDIDLHTDNDLTITLGDAAGVNNFYLRDSSGSLLLYIDSLGNIVPSGAGTVDGRDVAADGAKLDGLEYTEKHSSSHTISSDECYGGVHYVTAAATITLPAVAAGMSVTIHTIGAVAVSVDPNASDLIYLDGTALDDGDKLTNSSTAGDTVTLVYYDATGWAAITDGNWTDGGA